MVTLVACSGARTGDGGGEDFLFAGTRVVPEGMDEVIVGCQSLIVADELVASSVKWCIDGWIPALGSYTDISEKRCTSVY